MIFAVLDTNVLISAALAHNKYSIPYSVFRGVVEGALSLLLMII